MYSLPNVKCNSTAIQLLAAMDESNKPLQIKSNQISIIHSISNINLKFYQPFKPFIEAIVFLLQGKT